MLDSIENKRLKSLIQILATQTGNSYFESLVTNLSKIIPMKYIFVGVLSENKGSINTIAISANGEIKDNFLYDLKHTPCNNVMNNQTCSYQCNVQNIFPHDHLLVDMKIDSYLGFPLNNGHGEVIGIMVFLDEKPLFDSYENDRPFLDIIQILVGAELARYLSESKLKDREEFFRVSLDSIGDAIIVTSPDNKITRMNRVAEELTGWSYSECKNLAIQAVLNLTTDENDRKTEPVVLIKTAFKLKKKFILIDKSNKKKHITFSSSPIYNDAQIIIGDVLVFHDITKEHDMELQLRHTQKMEAIGQLAGGIAHDFNNILTGIIGCANILQRKSKDSSIVETYSAHIISSAKRTSELTRKLLDFSRKGKLLSTDLDIHQVIKEALQMIDHSLYKGVEIQTILNARNTKLIGDPSQLENSLLNMLLNACDAMGGIGKLTIKTENLTIDDSQIEKLELAHSNQFIEIEIVDNGAGISPEVLPMIFEPFFTTKEIGKGTGLGLAAVYGAIKDHHGAIQVWSELNKGTKFSILLPLRASDPNLDTGVSIKKNTVAPIKGTNTVLLVDDEYLIRHSVKSLFDDYKINTIEATNGEEAVHLFSNHKDKIDLIILDLIMPRMNGLTAYQEIRKIDPGIPILFISGFKKDLSDLKLDTQTAFLQKPFEEENLIACIKKLQSNKN